MAGRKPREKTDATDEAIWGDPETQDEERIQRLVDERVSAKMAELGDMEQRILARLREQATMAPAGAPSTVGDLDFLKNLAVEIVKAGDPTNTRRVVDPAVAKARADAGDRMAQAILEAHARGDIPVYLVRAKMFLNEMLIEPQWFDPQAKELVDTEINWPGVPNQGMEPLNESAQAIFKEFQASIGSMGNAPQPGVAPWVRGLTGKDIIRGMANVKYPTTAPSRMGTADGDPRRSGPAKPKTIRILGTVAEPGRLDMTA